MDNSQPHPPEQHRDELLHEQPEEVMTRAAEVGEERLARSAVDILITAAIAGVEVSLGGLGAAAVLGAMLQADPARQLFAALALAALVFPVGFIFVIVGGSELFTENFLIPVVAVIGRERSVRSLITLWILSWIGNLFGSAAIAALLLVPHAIGDPILFGYQSYTAYKLSVPLSGTFVSGILAGIVMTVLTWLIVALRDPLGKILVIYAAGYTLFASNLAHSIIGSSMMFVGCTLSHHSLLEVFRWLGVSTVGNLVGGVGLVTLFRIAQVWEKQQSL